jgi:hypothetical protein
MRTKTPLRLNSRQRDHRYDELKERDGEECRLCGERGYRNQGPNQLEIHRRIPKKGYDDLNNLFLAHHTCHVRLDPRGPSRFSASVLSAKTFDDVEPKRVTTVEMHKHLSAYPRFRKWILMRVRRGHVAVNKSLLNSGAAHCKVTQQTIQRYLDVITSDEDVLMIDDSSEHAIIVFRTDDQSEGEDGAAVDGGQIAKELMSATG